MFIVVREPERQFTARLVLKSSHERRDTGRTSGMPLKTVRILTTVTPDLDDPMPHSMSNDGLFLFVPYVGGSPFPFKIVAVDGEGNVGRVRGPAVLHGARRQPSPTALSLG